MRRQAEPSDPLFADIDGISVGTVEYAPAWDQPPHEHETGTLTLVVRGSLVERVGSREEAAGPLSVVVKPPGVRHANRFGPDGAATVQVALPAATIDAWSPAWRLGEWRWVHGGAAARPFLALLAALRCGTATRGEGEPLLYDLLAAIGRSDDEASRASSTSPPPAWLERARTRIADDPGGSHRVRSLAEDSGVHPVSLARAFRRHYGASVTAWIRRARVAAAASRLSGGDRPLSDVALESGFADQAHFCRVFKSALGVTPLGYRRLMRG